jgi:hypothetical protein
MAAFGRGGAFGIEDGVVPGTAVLGRGIVAELGWSELMTDTGTAVGLVASNEKLTTGVDEDKTGAPVVVAAGTNDVAADDAGTDDAGTDAAGETDEDEAEAAADTEVAWRAW